MLLEWLDGQKTSFEPKRPSLDFSENKKNVKNPLKWVKHQKNKQIGLGVVCFCARACVRTVFAVLLLYFVPC